MLKNNKRPFMTVPEISGEFGFPVSTLKTLISQGAFPVMKVGRNTYVMREAFLSYLSSLSASSLSTNSLSASSGNSLSASSGNSLSTSSGNSLSASSGNSLSASSGNSFSTIHVENENRENGENGENGENVASCGEVID